MCGFGQTAQMIKAAAMKPADRMRHIDHSLAFAGLADDPCLEAFKMRIDNRMIEVRCPENSISLQSDISNTHIPSDPYL